MARKYNIDKEFGLYRYVASPVMPPKVAGWMGRMMRPPSHIFKDSEVCVTRQTIDGYQEAPVELLVFEPRDNNDTLPCLVYYHGGGFMFGAAGYHYTLAKRYALDARCKVVFVQYRLAPRFPFPIPTEDSFAAYLWTVRHADTLNIDPQRVAVGGDSAGGCLAAAVAQMCRDRGEAMPLFQMLIYPVTDRRMQTASNTAYTDTPMWNSRLSAAMWKCYVPDTAVDDLVYASPIEAASFSALPPAYVEVAEFDCLHDEGLDYAAVLQKAGVSVTINDTKGTMHGYDIAADTVAAKAAVAARLRFMNEAFAGR